jgi:hypothetical protein
MMMPLRLWRLPVAILASMLCNAQPAEKFFPVAANLKPDGIPAIPAQLLEQIAPYSESRSAVLLDWNPARREILISTRHASVRSLNSIA